MKVATFVAIVAVAVVAFLALGTATNKTPGLGSPILPTANTTR